LQILGMNGMKDQSSRNPMARDLRQPKYKQQVIPNKKKPKPKRKHKHKGGRNDLGTDMVPVDK